MSYSPEAPKYDIVREMIRLGADARQLNIDGSSPLFMAVLDMDTEMLRILINAGADPNLENMDTACDSLYDYAEFDYRYEIWNLNDFGNPSDQDLANEDVWLSYLDRLAQAKGKRRPDHLILLRELGALSMHELNELPSSPFFGSRDQDRNKFEIRIEVDEKEKPSTEVPRRRAYTCIAVDGENIESQQCVDVPALIRSMQTPGKFDIFDCTCGKPRTCGATFHGVEVKHRYGVLIKWTLKRPQYVYSDDQPYDGYFGPAVTSTFWFRRRQMENALRNYFKSLREINALNPDGIEWPIYGQSIREILDLESILPIEDSQK